MKLAGRDAGPHSAAETGLSARLTVAALLVGALPCALLLWPASSISRSVESASGGRLQLAQAHGTVWSGSARLELRGGAGSRDARALPGRLHWTVGWPPGSGLGWPALQLRHDTALPAGLNLQPMRTAEGSWRLALQGAGSNAAAPAAVTAQLPAAVLQGLGTPWNTLAIGGTLALQAQAASLVWQAGRWQLDGQLRLELRQMESSLSPLRPLGSYTLDIQGGVPSRLQLATTAGAALVLRGEGQWAAGQPLRFRGEATAAPGREAVLNNVLNLIGRRDGARSIVSIG